ncbi:SCF ubiquitin ligase complex subunit cdc4 [Nowakowskiella sp. JEL0407]|nr:SCF ubiquitin ligase complex subunit cdc4 [Nowakowskiella sp. JEL0407]
MSKKRSANASQEDFSFSHKRRNSQNSFFFDDTQDLPSPQHSPVLPVAQTFPPSTPPSPLPEFLPPILNTYASLPTNMKSYTLLHLLRNSPHQSIQFLMSAILPSLKTDIIASLPIELTLKIISFLDLKTVVRCAGVSKAWTMIFEGNQESRNMIWKEKCLELGYSLNYNRISPVPFPADSSITYTSTVTENHTNNLSAHTVPAAATQPVDYKNIYKTKFITARNWATGKYKKKSFYGHDQFVVTCLHFDSEKIVSGSDDQTIKIWNLHGRCITTLAGHDGGVWALAMHQNLLVSGSTDRTVRVWDWQKGKCGYVFEGHTSTVRCMLLIPSAADGLGPIIVTGSRDTTLRVWRLPTSLPENDVMKTFKVAENPYFMYCLTGHTQSVRAIAGDENLLISGSYDNSVRIWDLTTGVCKWLCNGHREKVYSVGYSANLGVCVSGSMDSSIRVWNVNDGNCLYVLEGHTMLVGLLEISDDLLVSAAADSKLRIWDLKNGGECLAELNGHYHAITCFHVDKKLNRIVSGSEMGVKLWQLDCGYRGQGADKPRWSQGPNGLMKVYGNFVRDLVTGTQHVWRVAMDERRLVAAVQRNDQTGFEILDFGGDEENVDDDDEDNDSNEEEHDGDEESKDMDDDEEENEGDDGEEEDDEEGMDWKTHNQQDRDSFAFEFMMQGGSSSNRDECNILGSDQREWLQSFRNDDFFELQMKRTEDEFLQVSSSTRK